MIVTLQQALNDGRLKPFKWVVDEGERDRRIVGETPDHRIDVTLPKALSYGVIVLVLEKLVEDLAEDTLG